MTVSFADIAKTMDPMHPPTSLRVLAGRHRWPGGLPPVVSLQVLGLRHAHPETSKHRLLWLNSWLIHGFQLSLCNAVHNGRMMAAMVPWLTDAWLNTVIPCHGHRQIPSTTKTLAEAFSSKETLIETFPNIAHSFTKASESGCRRPPAGFGKPSANRSMG
jgi:hypothetical protein